MKELLLYGDSILQGVMYLASSGRYHLCADSRYDAIRAHGIEVCNRARMGATVEKGLSRLKATLGPCEPGTAVLLEFGGNDCDYDWEKISEDPTIEIDPHVPDDKYTELMEEAVDYVRSRGGEPVVASLPPIDENRYMDFISKNRSYDNILSWLGDVGALSRQQARYNGLAMKTAKRLGCPVVDLRAAFPQDETRRRFLCDDGIHPTEEGHGRIARVLTEYALA